MPTPRAPLEAAIEGSAARMAKADRLEIKRDRLVLGYSLPKQFV